MNSYQIAYNREENKDYFELVYSGELSFSNIHQIKDETNSIIRSDSSYHIIVKEVDIIDLSFIQLLYSLLKLNPNNQLQLQLNQEFTDLIQTAGFQHILKVQ